MARHLSARHARLTYRQPYCLYANQWEKPPRRPIKPVAGPTRALSPRTLTEAGRNAKFSDLWQFGYMDQGWLQVLEIFL